jgi:hypothetical protein
MSYDYSPSITEEQQVKVRLFKVEHDKGTRLLEDESARYWTQTQASDDTKIESNNDDTNQA